MSLGDLLPGRYRVATDPLRTERRIELAVVLLVLVLVLQLLYSGVRIKLLSLPEAVLPARDALSVGELYAIAQVSGEQSAELLSRPLFWEGRRPLDGEDEAASTSAAQTAGELKGLSLQGVFGGGDTAGAIIKIRDRQRRVLVGEEIDGWTVESVDANEVVLSSRGRRQSLKLRTGIVAAKATVPVAPAQAAPAVRPVELERSRQSAAPSESSKRESAGEDQLSLGGSRPR